MKTKQYTCDQLEEVVQALKKGKVIAFPTDTVYGIGVVYDQEDALHKLKQAKKRPDEKPIPMMVSSLAQIDEVAEIDSSHKELLETFMPGAFTIVVKRKESVPAYVSNGLDTIAIRMPDDAFVCAIMDALEKPLLVSSANISAQTSCSNSDDVLKQLDGRMDGIVAGYSKSDTPSTIVDLTKDTIRILREGMISKEEIMYIYDKIQ